MSTSSTTSKTYVASNPGAYEGVAVGTGQCVAFVQKAAGAPLTKYWKQGPQVKGNTSLGKGIAIATFQGGKYTNRTNGDSHAAIYIGQDDKGINVWDQWLGQVVHKRKIVFNHPKNKYDKPTNRGEEFYVIYGEEEEKSLADEKKPVGQGTYVVKKGDCLDSIAYSHGFFRDTLWNDPANSELKQERGDPNLLMEGDRVAIPALRRKEGHHGGIMLKKSFMEDDGEESQRLQKLAADGYPTKFFQYAGKWYEYGSSHAFIKHLLALQGNTTVTKKDFYSQGRLKLTDMDESAYKHRQNLHLRLWALKPLRPGGYAPGDDEGKYKSAGYKAIDSATAPQDIDSPTVNFRLWPPRFIFWAKPTSEKSTADVKSEGGSMQNFLQVTTTKLYKVKYTLSVHPNNHPDQVTKTDHEIAVGANSAENADKVVKYQEEVENAVNGKTKSVTVNQTKEITAGN